MDPETYTEQSGIAQMSANELQLPTDTAVKANKPCRDGFALTAVRLSTPQFSHAGTAMSQALQ